MKSISGPTNSDLLLNNRACPENANFKTGASNTFQFHSSCGLHETKKCWKFEFDILNSSGVTATQNIYAENVHRGVKI